MQILSAAIALIYLGVGAAPCLGGASAEAPAQASGEERDGLHEDEETHDQLSSGAEHCDHEAEPVTEARALCPCGCEEGQASSNPSARAGYGLPAYAFEPASIDAVKEVGENLAETTAAPPRPFDHVPIPS